MEQLRCGKNISLTYISNALYAILVSIIKLIFKTVSTIRRKYLWKGFQALWGNMSKYSKCLNFLCILGLKMMYLHLKLLFGAAEMQKILQFDIH